MNSPVKNRWGSALAYRDFRFLWAATACQSMGFGMDNVALGWLVYELTGDAFMVGVTAALRMIPLFLLGIVSGAVADRVDRRIVLRIVTLTGAINMFVLGSLLVMGIDSVWMVIALATLIGVSFAFLLTLRQSYTYDIVGSNNSLNGLSMLQIASQGGAVFGSLLAGFLIENIGVGWQFVVVGGTYFLSVLVLLGARESGQAASIDKSSVLSNLVGYVTLLKDYPVLLILMCLAATTEIFGFTHMSLIPVFAKDVLGVGAGALGILTAIKQLGGFLGLIALASLGDYRGKGKLMFGITICFGLGQVLFFAVEGVVFFAIVLLLVNACAMAVDTLYKTLMQENVPNKDRGRAMGAWVLSIGTAPIGHLGIGGIAGAFGAPIAFLFNGVVLTSAGVISSLSLVKIRRLP